MPNLFDLPQDPPPIDGETYSPELDGARLGQQMLAVWGVMTRGGWWTVREVHVAISEGQDWSESGTSARMRDFRKDKFGGHEVLRRRRGKGPNGVHEYKLIPNPNAAEVIAKSQEQQKNK